MKRDEYLKMLFEDNQTEKEPTKELHEAVLECAVEALSQESADFEADHAVGLAELYKIIEEDGSKTRVVSPFWAAEPIDAKLGAKYKQPIETRVVSPFRAAELIAAKLGAKYKRPIERFAHLFQDVAPKKKTFRLEDLL